MLREFSSTLILCLPIALVACREPEPTLDPTLRTRFASDLLSRHPYLQLATQDSIVIVWRTNAPIRPSIRFGTAPDQLNRSVPTDDITIRTAQDVPAAADSPKLHSAPAGTHQYEAKVTGLRPDRTYYYGVFHGNQLVAGNDAEHHFQTLPVQGLPRSLRFWAVGDSGTALKPQRDVFDAMRAFVKRDRHPLDAFLHVGDMAYTAGTDKEFQTKFFEIYTKLLRHTVCWPSMGNHEGGTSRGSTGIGPYYDGYVLPTRGEAGGLPSGKEAFYSYDFGDVHFICLDSHDLDRKPDGEMALWLRADLERTRGRWIIAYWHHPPYTLGSHDSDVEHQLVEMRTHIMPILESGGVDLVLTGHSHIYERSMLIDGAYVTPTTTDGIVVDDGDGQPDGDGPYRKSATVQPHGGTVSVVTGHGGTGVSRLGTMPIMRKIFVENGSVIVDVKNDTLTAIMLNKKGIERDRFQIVKRGTVKNDVVSFPWDARGPEIRSLGREFPEQIEVAIDARPNATDAKIHYTMDGTEPTLSSPIYDQPFMLTETTDVKAFSVWRTGTRISPVATASFWRLPRGISARRLITGGDDVEETEAGEVIVGERILELGRKGEKHQTVGLRFVNVQLDKKTKIKRAFVQFTCRNKQVDPAAFTVHMPIVADAEPLGVAPKSLAKLLTTSPWIAWTPPPWKVAGRSAAEHRTPNLGPMLQRVIDSEGWQSGNSVTVLLRGTGKRTAAAFEHRAIHAPFLWVEFE